MNTMERYEEFKFGTFNIDQAKIEENYEDTKFDNRWPKLKEMIKEANLDILCLQELRNLETSSISVPELLYQVSQMGYDYKHAYYGPDATSFAQVIFYKRDKFFLFGMDLRILPISLKSKPSLTKIILCIGLKSLATGKRFKVCNNHFGFDEQDKEASVEYLNIYLDNINDEPYICAGDFNFFDDRDGVQHRETMLETSVDDIAYPLANASGTFMGFKHDEFNQPFEKMSRLDHIFVNDKIIKLQQAYAFGDMELVKKREYPSDHLMIVVKFTLR